MDEKILLIEDEIAIADSVAYSLGTEGFKVEVAHDGLRACPHGAHSHLTW